MIDFNNYQVVDLLCQNSYSRAFFKYYQGLDNTEYVKGLSEKGLSHKEKRHSPSRELAKSVIDDISLHPFEKLKLFTYSIRELKESSLFNGSIDFDCNEEIGEKENPFYALFVQNDENFARLKLELQCLIVNSPKGSCTAIELKNNLQFLKDLDNSHLAHAPESVYAEFYRAPERVSFLQYVEGLFSALISVMKSNFNDELLKVDQSYEYIDDVVQYLFKDYSQLLKRIFSEKNYFAPVTKVLKKKHIELFQWLLSDYSTYLDKKDRKKLEQEVYPRDHIATFTVINFYKKQDDLKKMIAELIKSGYIEIYDRDRMALLFSESKKMDRSINWNQQIGSLRTFIDVLSKNEIITNTNKWEITARYFKVQGESITARQMRDSKSSKNETLIKELESIAKILK